MELDERQLEAISRCTDLSRRLAAVTGAAGTGKTTAIRKVYETLRARGRKVCLAAPTGKAAKRITEATGAPAETIHRLLEYPRPGQRDESGKAITPGYPRRDSQYPVEYDDVIVDEYPMVNAELHKNLTAAIPRAGRLIVFGDANQLPPIEGMSINQRDRLSPFETILTKFEGVTLEHVYRQGEGSGILDNAQRILNGRIPDRKPDFSMKITDSPIVALQDAVFEAQDDGHDYSQIDNQVIVVGKKSWVGTHKLNAMLQGMFRSERDGWVELPRHDWDMGEGIPRVRVRTGDKVIWTENNYDLEVFNGEIGIVVETDPASGEFTIDFGDRVVGIPTAIEREWGNKTVFYDPRKSVDLAYALTTHKMQGSECSNVIYVLNNSANYNQCRENFYTAVTRARQHVHLITDQRSLNYSVRVSGRGKRK